MWATGSNGTRSLGLCGRAHPYRDNGVVRLCDRPRRSCYTLLIAVIALSAALGCGGGGGAAPAVTSTSGLKPGNLTLNASSLDFGSVALGSSNTSSLVLSNASGNGGPTITVSQITIAGAGFSDTSQVLPFSLPPGQTSSIALSFSPKVSGQASGTLSILVNGSSDPAAVPLTGTGLAPGQLALSPVNLDFGSVPVGSSQDQTSTLSAGAADVTVSSAAWNGEGFSLSGITFPVVIPAGQNLSFNVTFAPPVAGSFSGAVSFASDATNSPITGTFTGNAVQNGSAHSVSLSWQSSPSQVAGYNVYRGTQPGGPYTSRVNSSLLPGLSFTDANVQSGITYFYVATAVDASQTESVYSNEAAAIIPAP